MHMRLSRVATRACRQRSSSPNVVWSADECPLSFAFRSSDLALGCLRRLRHADFRQRRRRLVNHLERRWRRRRRRNQFRWRLRPWRRRRGVRPMLCWLRGLLGMHPARLPRIAIVSGTPGAERSQRSADRRLPRKRSMHRRRTAGRQRDGSDDLLQRARAHRFDEHRVQRCVQRQLSRRVVSPP